jgi:hypothetical protein
MLAALLERGQMIHLYVVVEYTPAHGTLVILTPQDGLPEIHRAVPPLGL